MNLSFCNRCKRTFPFLNSFILNSRFENYMLLYVQEADRRSGTWTALNSFCQGIRRILSERRAKLQQRTNTKVMKSKVM